jgi:hypothetical protein
MGLRRAHRAGSSARAALLQCRQSSSRWYRTAPMTTTSFTISKRTMLPAAPNGKISSRERLLPSSVLRHEQGDQDSRRMPSRKGVPCSLRSGPVGPLARTLALDGKALQTLQVIHRLLRQRARVLDRHRPARCAARHLASSRRVFRSPMTSSTVCSPTSRFQRSNATSPRVTNSACTRRHPAAATTASSMNWVSDSPSRKTVSTLALPWARRGWEEVWPSAGLQGTAILPRERFHQRDLPQRPRPAAERAHQTENRTPADSPKPSIGTTPVR